MCGIEESATTLLEKFVATFLIMAPSPELRCKQRFSYLGKAKQLLRQLRG